MYLISEQDFGWKTEITKKIIHKSIKTKSGLDGNIYFRLVRTNNITQNLLEPFCKETAFTVQYTAPIVYTYLN